MCTWSVWSEVAVGIMGHAGYVGRMGHMKDQALCHKTALFASKCFLCIPETIANKFNCASFFIALLRWQHAWLR